MVLASELGEYAVSLRYSDLSEHAVHTAEQRLIDSLGCGWAPSPARPPGTAGRLPGPPPTRRPPSWARRRPPHPTWPPSSTVRWCVTSTTTTAISARKSDTPATTSRPACLAVAESEGASEEDLVLAVVPAYEIQCRFQGRGQPAPPGLGSRQLRAPVLGDRGRPTDATIGGTANRGDQYRREQRHRHAAGTRRQALPVEGPAPLRTRRGTASCPRRSPSTASPGRPRCSRARWGS
jgi:hypothetical protein